MPNPKVRTLTIDGVTYDLQDNTSGYTTNTGTVTSVGITNGGGLSVSGSPITTNGSITVGHSNSVTAQTTQGLYPIKIDANGHISAYGSEITSLPASDVYDWAKAATKPSYTFSEIGSKPTTISGYGITDAYTKTEVDNKVSAVLRYKGVKAAVSNLPTTGNVTGDVWHVTATSGEYAWDGTEWQELGTAISIPAATGSSTTGISIADHSTTTIYGVTSSTTSVTGVSGSTSVYGVKSGTNSTTTASKASGANGSAPTLGDPISIPNVTSAGSASTWAFENITVPIRADSATSIPNVTSVGSASTWSFNDITVPIRADSDTTVPTAASSATTVPIKATSATTVPIAASSATDCDDITAWSAGSGSLSFTMDSTDTKKLIISHTHTAPSLSYTARSITGVSGSTSVTGVQSTTTSVTGVSGSTTVRGVKTGTSSTTTASKASGANGTAPTLGTAISIWGVKSGTNSTTTASHVTGGSNSTAPTLGTAISVPNVTSVGSASTWSFSDVTVPIRADSATTVPTAASSATTVPIKDSGTTVVTSKTHSVTDSGHTHTI